MEIIIIGNRQAYIVSEVCRHVLRMHEDINVVYVDATAPDDQLADLVIGSDIVIIQENDKKSKCWESNINKTTSVFRIGDVSLDFIWPFGGQPHFRNRMNSMFYNGPFPAALGDAYMNRHLQANCDQNAIQNYILSNVNSFVDLDRYFSLQIERQRRIDRVVGSNISEIITNRFRSERLFINPIRPSPALMLEIMSPIDLSDFVSKPINEDDVCQVYGMTPELPLHPSVVSFFGITCMETNRQFELHANDSVSFEEYVQRYAAYSEGEEIECGIWLSAHGSHVEAINQLNVGLSRQFGSMSASANKAQALSLAAIGEISLAEAAWHRANELALKQSEF